ncbi:2-amino-4-hydroxy-6-hydroxymethyldihydropteridine diphosphokinase [Lacihabitans sp. LS3-19]|uniref:2-amino-4-hydroxy-6- hydroxymethyldihydropteridine diphosphokinase n=1 Tax=Lacihabitans sp. LS3-19 TaxID=2487335 RepID=UPI0020CCAF62|nr:2-amino-4-hydroxy-6-hydroxymethyldihydropteridine diphosphokinase [Lacihabitans sp. LS3-19]MCP9768503.1 2-amino-4-hydroxy-6-hydroxymethyldihydropteridine diphosphokinase [Lacihabitans sp. LS3-19]
MFKVFLGLGTNIGDRKSNIELAKKAISDTIGEIQDDSSVYETEAWGVENQENYYNQVICIKTNFYPLQILEKILALEIQLGRIRNQKWEARLIDIDILFFENYIISTDNLTIPHKYIQERNFVLEPLKEINPDFIHPKFRKTISELAKSNLDKSWIKKL